MTTESQTADPTSATAASLSADAGVRTPDLELISTTTAFGAQPTAVVTATTVWTPPSTTWPTPTLTLPADYGMPPPETYDVPPPRETFPPDAILPPVSWTLGSLTVRFTPPGNFRQDPLPLPAVGDYDRGNGLFVLERWRVTGEPVLATLSIQTNPGADSPLLSRTVFSETVVGNGMTWYLWNNTTVEQTGLPPTVGLAVLGNHLFEVSGTEPTMRAVITALFVA